MADLKPLGSEKLQGMDKIRRILEISRYKETTPRNENINESAGSTEYTTKLSDGFYYGIVKENRGYILMHGVEPNQLTYMDELLERKHYPSYSQALKRLNIIASEVNRNTGYSYGTPLIGEQSEPKKKFILKTPKPKSGGDLPAPPADLGAPAPPAPPADLGAPAPPAPPADLGVPALPDMGMPPAPDLGMPPMGGEEGAPAPDLGIPPMGGEEGAPAPDLGAPPMGGEEGLPDLGMPPMGGEEGAPAPDLGMPPMGGEEGEEGGPVGLKTIQKLTGRLSQKIRSFDKDKGMDSQDIKYVVNSILSAIDLSKLDEDDKEDILDKFDSFEDYGTGEDGDLELGGDDDFGMGLPMGGEPEGLGGEELPAPPPEETFAESRVEKVLTKYFKITENEKPILEEKRKKDFINEKLKTVKINNEITNLSETRKQEMIAKKLFSENSNIKFVGKTNKENLVFTLNGKQIKVTPNGRVI
jgi:hypothetical protein